MRFVRRLYGLTVSSEFDLPLPPGEGRVDVDIVQGPVAPFGQLLYHTDVPFAFSCYREHDEIVLDWSNIRFHVTADQVIIDSTEHPDAITLLLQPVWSVVLAARAREVLHGCVVERDGRAVAILGNSGSGKTTAGLALITRGWNLVSDDLLVLDCDGHVVPGPPFMRQVLLRRESLCGQADGAEKVRVYPAACPHPVPLAAIIVLAEEYRCCTEFSGTTAVDAVLTQVYNPLLTHSGQARRRLDLALGLANSVPIYGAPSRSLRGDDLSRLFED